jgi:hypothetical protein
MYRITLFFQFEEYGTHTEEEIAQDKDEMELIHKKMVDKWFKRICPNLSPCGSIMSYHLILRRINEMNNKDLGYRKFLINVEHFN